MWQPLPTEDVIRDNVYFDEYCSEQFFPYKYWSEPVHLKPVPDFCPQEEDKGKGKSPSASTDSSPTVKNRKTFHELSENEYKVLCQITIVRRGPAYGQGLGVDS
jgi:hypothetical protein